MKVTEMPLTPLGGHYAVMVKINDMTRPMIVDTGAELTTLSSKIAEELKLTADHSGADVESALGIGQTKGEVYLNVIPSNLGFGDLVYKNRITAVARIDFGKTPENDSIGLLGDDILSLFDVEFDFPGKTLTLYRELGCYDTFSPWTGTYSTIPFDHRGAKMAIDVMLNGERTRAIVDTGNNASFVCQDTSALWGIPDDKLMNTNGRSSSPLNGGTTLPVRTYRFAKIQLGDEIFGQIAMNVIDVDLPIGSANLGLDFWRDRKLWISYPRKWMFVSDGHHATPLAYPVSEPTSAPQGGADVVIDEPSVSSDPSIRRAAEIAPHLHDSLQ
jgi:predicted aspartyl protease